MKMEQWEETACFFKTSDGKFVVVVGYEISSLVTVEDGLIWEVRLNMKPPYRVQRFIANRYPKFSAQGPLADYHQISKVEITEILRLAEKWSNHGTPYRT